LFTTFGSMKAIASTKRLYLREMTADDAAQAFLLNSDPEVVRYMGGGSFTSEEAAREFLQLIRTIA